MPLVIIDKPKEDKIWGLWRITESYEELYTLLEPAISDKAKLDDISNEHKKLEFLASRLIIKNILEALGQVYSGTKSDSFGRPFARC